MIDGHSNPALQKDTFIFHADVADMDLVKCRVQCHGSGLVESYQHVEEVKAVYDFDIAVVA